MGRGGTQAMSYWLTLRLVILEKEARVYGGLELDAKLHGLTTLER